MQRQAFLDQGASPGILPSSAFQKRQSINAPRNEVPVTYLFEDLQSFLYQYHVKAGVIPAYPCQEIEGECNAGSFSEFAEQFQAFLAQFFRVVIVALNEGEICCGKERLCPHGCRNFFVQCQCPPQETASLTEWTMHGPEWT